MNYATNIALVDKTTNLVVNVIWGLIYQLEEFAAWGFEPVVSGELDVRQGDYYDGESFFRNGERVMSADELFAREIEERDKALAELIEIIFRTDMEEFE